MPPVTLHQPVVGLGVDDTYTGPMEDWLVANGYASIEGDTTDKSNLVDVTEDKNPTLASNREAPGEELEVLGEDHSDHEVYADNAAEDSEVETAQPVQRNRIIGADEHPEVQAVAEERDGSVDPADVEGFPTQLEEAVAAAEGAAETGDHLHDEPTDEVKEPAKRKQKATAPTE